GPGEHEEQSGKDHKEADSEPPRVCGEAPRVRVDRFQMPTSIVEMSDLPPPQPWTPTPQPRGYVAERPAQRSLSGQLASDMETQASSLLTMEAAIEPQAVAAFALETRAGTAWELGSVRHRVNRLAPPNSYWSVFAVDIY